MDLVKQLDMGYEGFAKANQETLEALFKAMEAGSGVNAAAFTGGRALTPESLDTVLVSVLHTTEEAKLFQRLKKVPVKSVVHQWNYRDEVGADDGQWVAEGGSSSEQNQNIARKYTTAKYMQTKRVVTLQAATSNMVEDAIAIEQEAGALWIIRNIEKALFNANSTMNQYEPDGLDAQIPATHIIDLRGKDATSKEFEDAVNEAARRIRDYFGVPTDMFCSTMVMQDVQALLRDRIRFGTGNVGMGSAIFDKYPTPFGSFNLLDDVFVKEGTTPRASALSGRPGTTTPLALGSVTTPTDATALFTAADAGLYAYKVEPINQYGAGAAIEALVSSGLAAGDNVTIAVGTFPVPAATAFRVYRSKIGGTTGAEVRYMFTVSQAQVVADSNSVIDRNFFLPGCSSSYILNLNTAYNAIEWVQFLPMMKFDLYPTDAAIYPFLMLLFGSLALKKPVHHVRIKNISPSGLGWF